MVNLLAKLVCWALLLALIGTVGGWWGMAIILAVAFVVYLAFGRRSRSA